MSSEKRFSAPRPTKRNAELRAVFNLLAAEPNQSIAEIGDRLGWTKSKARNDFMILEEIGLIAPSGNSSVNPKRYAVCAVSPEEVNEALPEIKAQGAWRDGLTSLLMGGHQARAPSLNFMDSINGV